MGAIALAQVTDESNLRNLIERFFAAYQKEDLEAIIGLRSVTSPDLPLARQSLQQTFAENDEIRLNNLALSKVKFRGEKAIVRVTVDLSAVDAKTRNPSTGLGKQNRTFHFIREGGNWKALQQVSTEDDVASALVEAGSEEKVQALLQEEKEFITVELQRALISKGRQAITQGKYQESITINQMAQKMAEGLGDQKGIALAARGLGLGYYVRADYKEAMNYFNTSLKISEEANDKVGVTRAFNDIGKIYQMQGNSDRALDYYEKGLKLAQETGEKLDSARLLINIGIIYQSRRDFL
jgi:tetratricopeptide (TPR) repeat protein